MTTTASKTPKNKVYETITNRIIEKIQAGAPLPWSKPWKPGEMPHNVSGRPYSGMNVFMLEMEKEIKGYTSNVWMTFKQATERGADLTGQKSTPVIFMKVGYATDKETGEEKKFFSMRYYSVFNADQCAGVKLPTRRERAPIDPIEAAEAVVNNMPNRPTMTTNRGERACYYPTRDEVSMPPRDNFRSAEAYYSVIFHELGHSTSHSSRLNREVGAHKFGSKDYSKEELVAEMTAAFLMGATGISNENSDNANAGYIQSWLKALQNDVTMLIQAASAAQKAADYILNAQDEEETEEE